MDIGEFDKKIKIINMLKGKIGLFVLVLIISVTVYLFYSKSDRLDKDGKVTMGVVINEVVYTKNSHLSSPENRIHKYKHPVTKGLKDFEIFDEVYGSFGTHENIRMNKAVTLMNHRLDTVYFTYL